MSPEDAVNFAMQAIRDGEKKSDEELLSRMINTGLDGDMANRLLVLVPLAFSRAFYEAVPMVKEYSEEYILYDLGTGAESTHDLASDPHFNAAVKAAAEINDGDSVELIASRSPEYDAINNVLSGLPEEAIPERIGTGPPYIPCGEAPPKPWWKFWD